MKYFTETRVQKSDGTFVVERVAAPTYAHAKMIALMIAQDAFREQLKPTTKFEFGIHPTFVNDYGEKTEIIAIVYPDMAQVKEGKFEK